MEQEKQTKTWYAMEQETDAEGVKSAKAEIFVYDEIGGYGIQATNFIQDLENLGEVEQIDLRISSPGGSIIEGNVIYNAIKRHPANVTVYIDGMAASMASVIAMAGDEIIMADNALLMIHNPWTVSIGDSEQLRKDAELMDKMKSAIINAYGRSNYSEEELEELMNSETWFTANEAIEAGLVDGTTEGIKAAASIAELEACAKQVGATLPVEKIVAGVVTKYEKQIDDLDEQVFEALEAKDKLSDTVVAKDTEIAELQNSVKEFKANAEQMENEHAEQLEEVSKVTTQKVAQAAAELMALQSEEAVAEATNESEAPVNADTFWDQYKAIGKSQGLEAKNKWYAENKHMLNK
jgi:ATP-dependent protease ClpP protease subunit